MRIEQPEFNKIIEQSGSELENMSHNLELAVTQELIKLGKGELAKDINWKVEEKKFAEMGTLSEKSNKNFDPNDYFAKRVALIIDNAINNQYKN